ncbi:MULTISPECIES: AAA family ATPase [Halorhodospira]|uniref:AAA family ATPase n=1 Tax=Halorhodospira TaxID=85108 RepID=UPI001EE890C8|nr:MULTISPECIES: AAA family ATPase [Halorhodospira]MCG5528593.1 helicase RepA family protein [Halorhodospira halophila]MCG5543744.1 helicase RepA family protein [Halorhodospira sp. 9628]
MSEVSSIEQRAAELATPSRILVPFGSVEVRRPQWVVRGILEADTLTLLFGEPKIGKSFVAVDLAASIASGLDWHGHRVEQGPVLYIAGEGHAGLARRRRAWEIARQLPLAEQPIYLSRCAVGVGNPADLEAIIEEVRELNITPSLVVIDTVARCIGSGLDENSNRDMGAFIAGLDRLRTVCGGSAILLVHHPGHGDKTRGRGATALVGAIDAEWRVERADERRLNMVAQRLKDAEPPPPLGFKLDGVELDLEDDEGEPVTSAVPRRVDYVPPKTQEARQADLDALEILRKLHSNGTPLVNEWRQQCQDAGLIATSSEEASRKAMNRCIDRLKKQGLVTRGIGRGVWIPSPDQAADRGGGVDL